MEGDHRASCDLAARRAGPGGRHAVSPPRALVLFGPPGTARRPLRRGLRRAWPGRSSRSSRANSPARGQSARRGSWRRRSIACADSAPRWSSWMRSRNWPRSGTSSAGPAERHERVPQADPAHPRGAEHLLVCATNWVRRLDPLSCDRDGRLCAARRPTRSRGREAIWRRYVDEITDEPVDRVRLVEASDLFMPPTSSSSPQGGSAALQREHFNQVQGRAVD